MRDLCAPNNKVQTYYERSWSDENCILTVQWTIQFFLTETDWPSTRSCVTINRTLFHDGCPTRLPLPFMARAGLLTVSIRVSSQTPLFPVAIWKVSKRAKNPRRGPLESISGPCRVIHRLTARTLATVVVRLSWSPSWSIVVSVMVRRWLRRGLRRGPSWSPSWSGCRGQVVVVSVVVHRGLRHGPSLAPSWSPSWSVVVSVVVRRGPSWSVVVRRGQVVVV